MWPPARPRKGGMSVSRTFILNEMWTQDKIYILIGTLLGSNILLTT
jgi:hypothetical protein